MKMCIKNIQGFIVKMGLHDAFREARDIDQKHRDGTFDHRSNFVDFCDSVRRNVRNSGRNRVD